MQIADFAQQTGLSPDTLRYYEKIGLLPPPLRDAGGRRVYQRRDLDWARFLIRLRQIGMPIAEMLTYARLRAGGDVTAVARRDLLARHRAALAARIDGLSECLSVLDQKIAIYQAMVSEKDADHDPKNR
ncbi:MAG: MerR family transcriptional regulator [Paracoccus sp. (in: a-proteobacteria)]|uniref:MerR family transcriptional regulator n=1 Tax=Paracoccus sp. TaxID=267 RepID=UPI0026E09377|nr:MerR family transcriptional regulator [Paracoccus sp. (in: a-proteobacteria)]MDO5630495.1 MerR family transcriptional regulator [Paracoccus sp. (in: a-proteobacteria)]